MQPLWKGFKRQHVGIGDLLRKEMDREGAPYAATIKQNMLAGTVGPMDITMAIAWHASRDSTESDTDALILDNRDWDTLAWSLGSLRNMEQTESFEPLVEPIRFLVLLHCPEDVYLGRLLPRGPFDGQALRIWNHTNTYNSMTSQVIDKLNKENWTVLM
ncbi:uridylate kinase [Colletotrichum liriopes]|uniref:Uridylate kinase n=1 Tax=Colletotrichum liriopes TaxID=708192 RepID=A0AA37LMV9_9PEZI|nr:uridylate kinase [Colletotrichum liriopes]